MKLLYYILCFLLLVLVGNCINVTRMVSDIGGGTPEPLPRAHGPLDIR